ncbi:hypothetical protein WMY93_021024 [Mugilogobius chulae]|uniref:EML-like first beta-propeller domain-containing protein n=1 Tax=Mugilogobius chulae TaxID=88201 RepID=A0AAW0NJJ4_9GOBI
MRRGSGRAARENATERARENETAHGRTRLSAGERDGPGEQGGPRENEAVSGRTGRPGRTRRSAGERGCQRENGTARENEAVRGRTRLSAGERDGPGERCGPRENETARENEAVRRRTRRPTGERGCPRENGTARENEAVRGRTRRPTGERGGLREMRSADVPESQPAMEESRVKQRLPRDMFYDYDKLESKASVSPDSEIPLDLLHLSHSFGYDCKRRANLQLLDEQTLMYIAGNMLVLQDIKSKQQKYLRSSSGQGIGAIATHPDKWCFAVGEKGSHPNIIIYEYPSLRPYRILRGGTERAYCHLDFSADGELLASVGASPDYMLTLWDWRQEEVKLSSKAVSQDVYRVSFSSHTPGLLTSCGSGHIKFWKMDSTFTGLKLQGIMGSATDIESYVDLPGGKVVSGSEWGNLLLWDGNSLKVEICRKEGRTCHAGTSLPFAISEGQLLTMGADGAVRGWNLESISGADCLGESSSFELEPTNELLLGHNVSLSSVVRSGEHDSFIWFAQDAMGAIWKLDLSFTHTTPDPECLFQFHGGAVRGLDVSRSRTLMATTAQDGLVKVFDFFTKKQLTSSGFNQGGTAVCWGPPQVERRGGLLTVGFEDGVVRLLDPHGGGELHLRQAFKPHSKSVSALAYERRADYLATGSSDCTVFFFRTERKFQPIGFVSVPGPVIGLEWSPHSHRESRLLVLCQSGHVLEVDKPDVEVPKDRQTYELSTLHTRAFYFKSIKSRILREKEVARRQALKEKKRQAKSSTLEPEELQEENEEELPPIHTPNPPSPLCCGFYSQPGRFWICMGGYDAGFLYHCEFSEQQEVDPAQRQDEPFKALPLHDADQDPIISVTFSPERHLLLCGMSSGSLRVYPLSPEDYSLESMQHYWTLSIHDNNYGPLRHLRVSYDDLFVLTAGDDGNIFSFSLLPPEDIPQPSVRAKLPSPMVGLEHDEVAQDIEDPSASSIETAKQRLESERERREAEEYKEKQRLILKQLQKRYKELIAENQALPEHVRLQPQELRRDPCFDEEIERMKRKKLREVQREMAWEQEKSRIALEKLQHWFKENVPVTVVAIATDHRISTYCLPSETEVRSSSQNRSTVSNSTNTTGTTSTTSTTNTTNSSTSTTNTTNTTISSTSSTSTDIRKGSNKPGKGAAAVTEEEVVLAAPFVPRPPAIKLSVRQEERLKKAAEKAEQARAKIQKRKDEWAQLYAEKPDKNYEDPEDVQAILTARNTLGTLKLKSSPDFILPKHLRVNSEKKREQLAALEEKMRLQQTDMNTRIIALRDRKLELVNHLQVLRSELGRVQRRLPAEFHRPCPTVPTVLPEETTDMERPCTRALLQRYKELKEPGLWFRSAEVGEDPDQDGTSDIIEQLHREMDLQSNKREETISQSDSQSESEEEGLMSEREKNAKLEQQIRLKYRQDCLITQMQGDVCEWDALLRMLLHEKLLLDQELKMGDLQKLTMLQELQVLEQFESRKESVQSKLSTTTAEGENIKTRLQELNEQLECVQQDISRLQDREKALTAAFITSLGENNKCEDFLTRVFKKIIRPKKKKSAEAADAHKHAEQEDSEDEEDDEWDEDDDEEDQYVFVEEEGEPVDDSVCPPNCDPLLFENTLQLRERKLEVNEQLQKAKKSAEALQKDHEMLTKRRETKQQKINDLDVVVPLRLHQIQMPDGELPTDLSQVVVMDRTVFQRLQNRIPELKSEVCEQKQLFKEARQKHARLKRKNAEMGKRVKELDKECEEAMIKKFGRVVDLEALQTLSENRVLEELKQEQSLREVRYAKEIRQWDRKVDEARDELNQAIRGNSERMARLNQLIQESREQDRKLNTQQQSVAKQYESTQRRRDQQDIQHLQKVVKSQAEQATVLRKEIQLLSRKGGHILPPGPAPTAATTGPNTTAPRTALTTAQRTALHATPPNAPPHAPPNAPPSAPPNAPPHAPPSSPPQTPPHTPPQRQQMSTRTMTVVYFQPQAAKEMTQKKQSSVLPDVLQLQKHSKAVWMIYGVQKSSKLYL